jgi:hypothetical protein
MDNSKCVILVPIGQRADPECDEVLRQLDADGYKVWRFIGCSQIDLARNILSVMALSKGFEELFWIDSDIIFAKEDVDRLRNHNLPIVCGLYTQRVSRSLSCYYVGDGSFTMARTEGS